MRTTADQAAHGLAPKGGTNSPSPPFWWLQPPEWLNDFNSKIFLPATKEQFNQWKDNTRAGFFPTSLTELFD
jgi:hypothetical protein